MNKKVLVGLMGMTSAMLLSGLVHAQTVNVSYQGATYLQTEGGAAAECTLTLNGTVDDVTGAVSITSATVAPPVDAVCDYITLSGFPWVGSLNGDGSVTLTVSPNGVFVIPTSEFCDGPVTFITHNGALPSLPSTITINPAQNAGNLGGSCTISGSLSKI